MSERRTEESNDLVEQAFAQLMKGLRRHEEPPRRRMKPREVMIGYLMLPGKGRKEFDRLYVNRGHLLSIVTMLRRATPEQIRRVREMLDGKPGAGGGSGPHAV